MDAPVDPLAGAVARPLRIRFYIDGYYAYLLSQQVIKLHQPWLKKIVDHFPGAAALFDAQISPHKEADLVLRLLTYAENKLIARREQALSAKGINVIAQKDVDLANNRFSRKLFGNAESVDGRAYVEADSFGIVFCPKYDQRRIIQGLAEFRNALAIEGARYAINIKELSQIQKRVERGDFEWTQRFYDALADRIGDVSDRGDLKLSFNVGRRPIEEKGVDGDFITALAFDAADDLADVYVLLTNDSDHAPAAERLVERGKEVILITYSDRPARALRLSVGDDNVIDLLTDEREFDFDPIWLSREDPLSLNMLEDMRMQWIHWKTFGTRRG
jgi:uncharacterized LabA/DUF88 family protein